MTDQGVNQNIRTRIKADLTLLLVAALWGSSFAAQRTAALAGAVHFYNGTRFLIGGLLLIPFWLYAKPVLKSYQPSAWAGALLAGCALFVGTAFQQIGLLQTSAANAGFITGLYVVIIPILLSVFFHKPPRLIVWVASLLATAGMFLLSTGGRLELAPGDGWELLGALIWAFHVLIIGWAVKRMDILTLAIIQYFTCGLLSLGTGALVEHQSFADLSGIWGAVIYTSVFSIALGFTLQAVGQRTAPAADAAIILCGESIFAALFGWLILKELLFPVQMVGCGLMLAGMLLAQTSTLTGTTSPPGESPKYQTSITEFPK